MNRLKSAWLLAALLLLPLAAGACAPAEEAPATGDEAAMEEGAMDEGAMDEGAEEMAEEAADSAEDKVDPPAPSGGDTEMPSFPEYGENLVDTPSGLQYEDLVVGEGTEASAGGPVSVHYSGFLENQEMFDSSITRGTPFEFMLGGGQVIQGWDEGVQGMRVGGKRVLVIPADLAYGAQGRPPVIPPNSTLIFEVELLNAN